MTVELSISLVTTKAGLKEAIGPLPTLYGQFLMYIFDEKKNGKKHLALTMGDIAKSEMPLIRVHSSCITGETFNATNCECKQQIDEAMRRIADYECGAIIYLDQEGRANGLAAKTLALNKVVEGKPPSEAFVHYGLPSDQRDYRIAAEILKILGIGDNSIRLLTNSPDKLKGLQVNGIQVAQTVDLVIPTNHRLAIIDLESKRNLGHSIPSKIFEIELDTENMDD